MTSPTAHALRRRWEPAHSEWPDTVPGWRSEAFVEDLGEDAPAELTARSALGRLRAWAQRWRYRHNPAPRSRARSPVPAASRPAAPCLRSTTSVSPGLAPTASR